MGDMHQHQYPTGQISGPVPDPSILGISRPLQSTHHGEYLFNEGHMTPLQLLWAQGLPEVSRTVRGLLFQFVVTVSFCTTATRDLAQPSFQVKQHIASTYSLSMLPYCLLIGIFQ